ncbi:MAG: U32 family peptidase [Bacteroidales bacterium]|nr:U32 family peptidase [Bacteroidales bacterium]MCF8456276.1 U32 family peptidase [Bacteroidales bacterium]
MKRKIELLAPGGDIDSIKAAIVAGADAVYCGLDKFNARNRAANITFDNLQGIIRLAHKHKCQVFLTLNILVVDSEVPEIIGLLNRLVNTRIDGVIVQDLGMLYLLSAYFKSFKIHASTQLTTHNEGQMKFLSEMNVERANLSRELNIHEIKALTTTAHENNILTEVFVHGSYCISFSGLCYISSVQGGKSGNRGRCSQPCRDRYIETAAGKNYPLNLKDNSAFFDLPELHDACVDSLKIEGRIKDFEYVYTVVDTWRKHLSNFYEGRGSTGDNSSLYKVFNRDFSNSFLKGDLHKEMFIDNPRNHATLYYAKINSCPVDGDLTEAQLALDAEKEEVKEEIRRQIDSLNIDKIPLQLIISGKSGTPLKVLVKTPESTFEILSKIKLKDTGAESLDSPMIMKRLKAINDTEYFLENIDLDGLQAGAFIPFNELTSIKKRILFTLNGSREPIDPIKLPVLKRQNKERRKPGLSVLISSAKDVSLCNETNARIYFQLPNSLKNELAEFIDLFRKNEKLIPWFPSILIGADFEAAVEFLQKLQPKCIVSNNIGIGFEAHKSGIPWIAGPSLNIVNSYSLIALKENFNCSGAFISNEIGKHQMYSIKIPDDFELYYSIYHPIELMTSRQCLFHQVTGCVKNKIDATCISHCEKSASITNLKNEKLYIEKSKGNYHRIYHESNFLNMDIVTDFPFLFSGFLIDLRDIKTETKMGIDKLETINLFENHLDGVLKLAEALNQNIHPVTDSQYRKGI